MKKLILILILLAGAGYAVWPYHVSGQFRDALNEPDVKTLEKLVDWPALRDSVKAQLQAHAETLVKERNRGTMVHPTQSEVIKSVLEKAVGDRFTPENFAKDVKKRDGKPDLEKVEITSRTWNSATEFHVKSNIAEGPLRFTMAGASGWKLVDIQLGPDEVDMKALVAIVPMAPGQPAATLPKKEQWIFKGYQNPLDKKATK